MCNYFMRKKYEDLEVKCQSEVRLIMLFAGSVNLVVLLKLENVVTANALQLEVARSTPALSGFNYYTPCQV